MENNQLKNRVEINENENVKLEQLINELNIKLNEKDIVINKRKQQR